jgi:hypothetical protein
MSAIMRTPARPLPPRIARWTRVLAMLRGLDAFAAWLVAVATLLLVTSTLSVATSALLAVTAVAMAAFVAPVRVRWRPVSAWVCLKSSRSLRPGARAWYVRLHDVELVVVTARRGLRLVIATPGRGGAEGISVRRTRVLLVPADAR